MNEAMTCRRATEAAGRRGPRSTAPTQHVAPVASALALIAALALAVLALLAPSTAHAQAPGPMSKGHAHLSGALDCQKCHEGGAGVPDKQCLGCHDHRDLRQRIEAGKGFHADPEVKAKPCKDCHKEHVEEPPGSGKGRKTTVDWRPFGGLRNFPHQRAGWPLQGAHRFEKCESCHEKKLPKSGNTTFLGLRTECTSCHKTPHAFADPKLAADCLACHNFDSRRVANLAATKYDHDKTAYPLVGAHTKNECKKCHVGDLERFQVTKDFSDCRGCHQDPHRSVISAGKKCASCHDPKVRFELTKYDHARETGFALRGEHARNKCEECHAVGKVDVSKVDVAKLEKPRRECASCHVDVHKGRFGAETCDGCHVDGGPGWKQMVYAHGEKTKFELTGSHAKTTCINCHRTNREPKGFEKLTSTACADCHKHQDAHCGQFGQEGCERCHVRGGDRTSKFDHSLTRFKLDGAHAEPACSACHKPAKLGDSASCRAAVKYTGLDPQCLACHEDRLHKGELGRDCAKCHTGGRDWKTVAFDHNRDARFSLVGFHQIIACETCHVGRKYKIDKVACSDCHLKDDAHAARLGRDCAKCHEPTGGAPKFDHDLHTTWSRSGVHARVECERCHFLPGPDEPGRAGLAATAAPGAPLDLLFRVGGTRCEDCHPNPHGVRASIGAAPAAEALPASTTRAGILGPLPSPLSRALGQGLGAVIAGLAPEPAAAQRASLEAAAASARARDAHRAPVSLDCKECHGFERWKQPAGNGYHERAGFQLDGAHAVMQCGLCHSGGTKISGKGQQCGLCHVADDIHAGSFGGNCGRCHDQLVWRPARFSHVETGFMLEGLHRNLDCRQCHNAGTFFVGNRCYNCHLSDYRAAAFHVATTAAQPGTGGRVFVGDATRTIDCGECHNQFAWTKGTFVVPTAGPR